MYVGTYDYITYCHNSMCKGLRLTYYSNQSWPIGVKGLLPTYAQETRPQIRFSNHVKKDGDCR